MLPVEMRSDTTIVEGAVGLPKPFFVYPNANDFGYGIFLLDATSLNGLLSNSIADLDPFLRAMLWGSVWDLVREARFDPTAYALVAMRAAVGSERDEQIVARLLSRIARSFDIRIAFESPLFLAEPWFLQRAGDTTLTYGLRKSFLDAYITIARTPSALTQLDRWLDSTSAAGLPLRQPTRWSIVTALAQRGYKTGGSRLAAEALRDTSTGGKRRAFITGAAFPSADVKRAYFDHYFRDSTLNEDWVTASLGAFNTPGQDGLTMQFLRPALDTLPWIQKNRRIFFLGSWLNAFIGGQRTPEALAIVDKYLAEHPNLPRDLRLKVLQARDDLERTVRIRAAFP